jgi:crotonobetainyl-CoA:carnitine CoA-transferase CaiB-like acyl-CoA transferase
LRKTRFVNEGLLDGVRVLDLSIWRPGPYATQLLGELGADIVKIEPPGGDPMRSYPELFAWINVNKRSEMCDLKQDAGRARVLELARDADVVIEGFRPGVAARLGVAYDDVRVVNPEVVYCSVSGMGQVGALATAPGHDLNFQAWSGALAPDGGAPQTAAVPIADLAAGMTAAYAICAAIVRKLRTGEGDYIDVAMGDVLATWTGPVQPRAVGVERSAHGVAGYGSFPTADGGFVALGVLTEDHFWRALCRGLGLDDAAELSFVERSGSVEALNARIAAAIATRARDPLVVELLAVGVPISPVLDRTGMLELAHFRERGLVTREGSADWSTGHPARFVRHPAARTAAAPELDEHKGAGFRSR